MDIKHTINKNEGTVTVDVVLPTPVNASKIRINTTYVEAYLVENKIKIQECVKSDIVNNLSDKLTGQWIFKLDKPNQKVLQSKDESYKSNPKSKRKRVLKKEHEA